VDDGANVGLVHAHAEGVRCHDDRRLARHEGALRLGARTPLHPGVVGGYLDPELTPEARGRLLGLLARPGVHDRGQRRGLAQQRARRLALRPGGRHRDHVVGEVRALEAGRDPNRVGEPEAPHDVGRDPGRRRCGRREDRARAEPPRHLAELEVLGPEVVPPLAHAVRLVDHEEADLGGSEPISEPRRCEALRRHVQHSHLAGERALEGAAVRARVALRVDQLGAATEALDLVGHQRDERRHDDREPAVEDRRKLVTEGLPGAGRHHEQDVPSRDDRLDRLALAGPEPRVPEFELERRADVVARHCFDQALLPHHSEDVRPGGGELAPGRSRESGTLSRRSARPAAPRAQTCRSRPRRRRAGTRR
jgi:hypothetical protein